MEETKLIEMYGWIKQSVTDIKWIKEDAERRNGLVDDHIADSNKFRTQVTRNTTWRVAYLWAFVVVFGAIGIIFTVIKIGGVNG